MTDSDSRTYHEELSNKLHDHKKFLLSSKITYTNDDCLQKEEEEEEEKFYSFEQMQKVTMRTAERKYIYCFDAQVIINHIRHSSQ